MLLAPPPLRRSKPPRRRVNWHDPGVRAGAVEGPSTVSSASVAEGQARQLFLDLLLLSTVLGPHQAVRELEESLALGVLGPETEVNQLRDDSAGAGLLGSGERR